MRDRFVATARSVDMVGLVPPAAVVRRARIGIGIGNRDHMFIDVISVRVM